MNFLSPLLLSISLNLDTLGISGTLKSKNIIVNRFNMIIIGILTTLGTLISMILGKFIKCFLTLKLSNIFGGMLLSFVGIYFIIEYIRIKIKHEGNDTSYYVETLLEYKKILEKPELVDVNNSYFVDLTETLPLSFSLLLNNIIAAIAASITGVNIPYTVFFNFIITILFFCIGDILSNSHFISFLYKYNALICGVFLIFFGIFEMFI